ncbi:MAG: glutaredoxin family protein [Candidatus Micrarchaeota archaeon]
MTVIVYSTLTCPYCVMVKDYLKQHKVEFEDVNLSVSQDRVDEMIQKSGQTGVPVLDIDGRIIVGFNRNKIKEILKLKD